ncbi:DUF397 domain-containing protein [Streptomyces europaeiscabiei]|uniref:DUF397 domain-containing protein n=1 Tax=Streptomyces europaeiscabiei TaxID=146819 RepID=A0AAJ2UQ41_9ACTN|nr:DUF397 domain-containing protein [Streptomyces europaeiscabiei]MDX3135313.1 DUF397 domain-containing protein [Streptomyces europaeiscabiei]
MSRLHWQKSTSCGDASNCVTLATAPTGHILLRESDTPTAILTTTHAPLRSLIQTLKAARPATPATPGGGTGTRSPRRA